MHRPRITRTGTLLIVLAVMVLAATACDWTQFRAGPARGGYMADSGFSTAKAPGLVERWAAPTGGAIQSSPAVVNGVAYVGSDDGTIDAFDVATGDPKWSVPTGGAVASSPAVDNGVLYIGSDDHQLRAIRLSDHAVLWAVTLDSGFAGPTSAPMVVSGVIYASSATSLYAYRADGTLLWSTVVTTGAPLSVPSAINGIVHVSSYGDASIWAFRADTGAPVWSTTVPGPRAACAPATPGPTETGTSVVVTFCPSTDAGAPSLFSYQADTGAPLWSNAPTQLSTSVSVGFGPLYAVSSVNHTFEARSQTDGSLLWSAPLGAGTSSTPSFGLSVVYIATDDHKITAFDGGGVVKCSGSPKVCAPLWTATTGGAIRSTPALSNGAVYVGSDDQKLHAFGLPPSGFGKGTLTGTSSGKPTALRFGPDGRLYVASSNGLIKAYTVARNERELLPRDRDRDDRPHPADPEPRRRRCGRRPEHHRSPAHRHDGHRHRRPTPSSTCRRATHGSGPARPAACSTLDTNSGVVSRLTRSGSTWQRRDLVRGLPRSQENHATNTLVLDKATQRAVRRPGRQHQHGRAVQQLQLPARVRLLGRDPAASTSTPSATRPTTCRPWSTRTTRRSSARSAATSASTRRRSRRRAPCRSTPPGSATRSAWSRPAPASSTPSTTDRTPAGGTSRSAPDPAAPAPTTCTSRASTTATACT